MSTASSTATPPALGRFNFSQVSGVGVEPAMAHGLALVGVNYVASGTTGGRLVRKLWPEVPLPRDLSPNQPYEAALDLSLIPSDPARGQILAVIDHPTVNALTGQSPLSPQLQGLRQIAGAVGLASQKSCPGTAAEVLQRPGEADPEGGLVNSILTIPYTKETKIDDPFIAKLDTPLAVIGPYQVDVMIYLGFYNNQGAEQADVEVRLWAREPDSEAGPPDKEWGLITLRRGCCTEEPYYFSSLPLGTWEIVAEIIYPGDTHPGNNRVVNTIQVHPRKQSEPPGTDSSLNN